ncbi:MAG: hypothetical protein OXI79_10915 [Gammaproteobacteria bacterium]|nr:hypothetical protein [Gammaproteobacteria bacterium]
MAAVAANIAEDDVHAELLTGHAGVRIPASRWHRVMCEGERPSE